MALMARALPTLVTCPPISMLILPTGAGTARIGAGACAAAVGAATTTGSEVGSGVGVGVGVAVGAEYRQDSAGARAGIARLVNQREVDGIQAVGRVQRGDQLGIGAGQDVVDQPGGTGDRPARGELPRRASGGLPGFVAADQRQQTLRLRRSLHALQRNAAQAIQLELTENLLQGGGIPQPDARDDFASRIQVVQRIDGAGLSLPPARCVAIQRGAEDLARRQRAVPPRGLRPQRDIPQTRECRMPGYEPELARRLQHWRGAESEEQFVARDGLAQFAQQRIHIGKGARVIHWAQLREIRRRAQRRQVISRSLSAKRGQHYAQLQVQSRETSRQLADKISISRAQLAGQAAIVDEETIKIIEASHIDQAARMRGAQGGVGNQRRHRRAVDGGAVAEVADDGHIQGFRGGAAASRQAASQPARCGRAQSPPD